MTPKVEIDPESGFCFGVVTAIRKAEEALAAVKPLYCLGDIVHNSDEVERLSRKGLTSISHEQLADIPGATVLLRAHGEPPSTYLTAERLGIKLLDATCPVVLRLQQRIKQSYNSGNHQLQIVIYGKEGHAEVNGLVGQTEGSAIVVQSVADINRIDFSRPVDLYSQTTMSVDGFATIRDEISSRMHPGIAFAAHDTICRNVANRVDSLRSFARAHDVVFFVSGHKSSNGRFLYGVCRDQNSDTHLIANATEVSPTQVAGATSVGICGATSTPLWLMEDVRSKILSYFNSPER